MKGCPDARTKLLSDEPFPLNSSSLPYFLLNSKPFTYTFLLIKRLGLK